MELRPGDCIEVNELLSGELKRIYPEIDELNLLDFIKTVSGSSQTVRSLEFTVDGPTSELLVDVGGKYKIPVVACYKPALAG